MARSISFDIAAIDKASRALEDVGKEVSDLGRKIDEASGTIEVDADTAKAQEKLRAVDSQLAKLNAKSFRIDADTQAVERKLQILQAELARTTDEKRRVEIEADISQAQAQLRRLAAEKVSIDVDTAAARAKIATLDAELRGKGRKTIDVDVDSGGAFAKLSQLGMQLKNVSTPVQIVVAFDGAMRALSWISSVSAGLASLGAVGVGAAGVTASALYGIGDAFTALGEKATTGGGAAKASGGAADKAAEAFSKLTVEGQAFALFLRGLVDGPLKDLQQTSQRELLPGLSDGMRSFFAELKGADTNIQGLSRNVGQFFRDVGPAVGRAADALLRLANLGSGPALGGLADILTRILDRFTAWANNQSADKIAADIQKIGDDIQGMWQTAVMVFRGLQLAWDAMRFSTSVFMDPIGAIEGLYDAVRNFVNAIPGMSDTMPELSVRLSDYTNASDRSAAGTRNLDGAMRSLDQTGRDTAAVFASAEQANLRYEESLARAKASVDANGTSISLHTEKGRANRQALLELASAANGVISSMQNSNAPISQVTATHEAQRQKLINVATQMGMTKAQAQQYIDKLLQVPTARNTDIKVNNAQALAGAGAVSTALANIKDKTVSVLVKYTSVTATGSVTMGRAAGGLIPGRPSGVDTVPAMLARGEYVVNSRSTQQWLPLLEQINAGTVPGDPGFSTSAAAPASGRGGTKDATVASAPGSVLQLVFHGVLTDQGSVARGVAEALRTAVAQGLLPPSVLGGSAAG